MVNNRYTVFEEEAKKQQNAVKEIVSALGRNKIRIALIDDIFCRAKADVLAHSCAYDPNDCLISSTITEEATLAGTSLHGDNT